MRPQEGDPATLFYPTDRYPYRVIAVSPTGKRIQVAQLTTDGLRPSGYCNGFPVFDHRYSAEEVATNKTRGDIEVAYLHSDGCYYLGYAYLAIGEARYYRNEAD